MAVLHLARNGKGRNLYHAISRSRPKMASLRDGGQAARWSHDGKWLYFWKPDNMELMKASVNTSESIPSIGEKDETVVRASVYTNSFATPVYAVTRDALCH